MSFLGKVIKTFGSLREPVKKIAQVGYNVGKWAVNKHSTIVPLIHSIATASGNETARKITGGLLALSQTATMRQKLNADNQKIASTAGKGAYGVYDHGTNKFM